MKAVETIRELRRELGAIRPGRTVGLVPTMGAFHDGHLSLIRAARAETDVVVVSVFVNPTQFGHAEDLASYPSNSDRDLRLAAAASVDLILSPSPAEMYPEGFQTWVEVEEVARGLEGDVRPGHFRGVATVCLKLFNIVRPDRAYFGQKDAQQAAVVEQMVRDLNVDLELRVLPTVRDPDGLALSSRNAYLAEGERLTAVALPRALAAGLDAYRQGGDPASEARALLERTPGLELDYVEGSRLNGHLVLAAAIRVGGTRLIDNLILEGEHS